MIQGASTTVVIVDDHPCVREGLSLRMSLEEDLEVVGEATDLETAEELIREREPAIAVVDIALESGSGIELVKRIRRFNSTIRILVCSMHRDDHYAQRALSAGAQGFINKQARTEEIVAAIRKIAAGENYFAQPGAHLSETTPAPGSAADVLSDRELETFENIGNGLTTEQIAVQMNLSPKTIETYRARIKMKLNLGNMAELSRAATQWVLERN